MVSGATHTTADTIRPALRANLPYDLERDLTPVSLVTIAPFLLVVHPSVPAHNVKELIALARSQPGKLSYGSSGVGGTSNLAGELLKFMAKVNESLNKQGIEVETNTPEQFAAFIHSEIAQNLKLIRSAGIKAE